jgi:hypothetical protein
MGYTTRQLTWTLKKKVLCAQHELEMHQTQGLTAPDSTE